MKNDSYIASFSVKDNVYILCDDLSQEIKTWTSPQAATKWFKRYFSAIWRTRGDDVAHRQFDHFAFRIHRLSTKMIEDDLFEASVVKAPYLLDQKLAPQDHVREPVAGPAVHVVGLMCQGDRAVKWRDTGMLAPFSRHP